VTSIQPYGVLAQVIADSASVHRRLDQLTAQASSGRIADTYAGLGAGARVSLDLAPQLTAIQAWQTNTDAAAGRLQVTQSAMTRIQQIASDFNAQLNSLNGLNPQNIDVAAASARNALTELAGLLDTQDGGTYVFAGQDTANPPVPNPDAITASGFFTQIAAAVAGLGVNGAAATAAATLAVASSNAAGTSPFSAYLSQPAAGLAVPLVQTGPRTAQQAGLLASANSAGPSTGASTTGSAMRDLMRGLATIGSLSSAQADDSGFAGLVQDTRTSLGGAIDQLAVDAGALGNVQSGLTARRDQLGSVATARATQLSSTQDVDMAATLSNLTQVQAQLQASYQLIASLSGLTLAKFLPAG
jgi:flagellar hook-associated protein 3 FlgL